MPRVVAITPSYAQITTPVSLANGGTGASLTGQNVSILITSTSATLGFLTVPQGILLGTTSTITSLTYSNPASTFSSTTITVSGTTSIAPTYTGASSYYNNYRIAGRAHLFAYYINTAGGTAGAGTDQVSVDLAITASTSFAPGSGYVPIGSYRNGSTQNPLFGTFSPGGSKISLAYFSAEGTEADLTAADQNNTTRIITISFWYPV